MLPKVWTIYLTHMVLDCVRQLFCPLLYTDSTNPSQHNCLLYFRHATGKIACIPLQLPVSLLIILFLGYSSVLGVLVPPTREQHRDRELSNFVIRPGGKDQFPARFYSRSKFLPPVGLLNTRWWQWVLFSIFSALSLDMDNEFLHPQHIAMS